MRRTLTETLAALLAISLKLHDKATAENWMGDDGTKKEVATKLEEKIAALGVGSSTKEAVADLLNLSNPKLKIRKKMILESGSEDKVKWKNGLVVVPLKNGNSHDYKIGQPAIFCNGERCVGIRRGGNYSVGNHIGTTKKSLRLATKAEIRKFFADMKKGTVDRDGVAYLEVALS